MLQFLFGVLGVIPAVLNTVDGIEKEISNEKLAQISATTDQARIASQERIDALQARANILIAEAATPAGQLNAKMRALAAAGPISLILKLSLWDKVIGSFAGCSGKTAPGTCGIFITDPIDPHIWYGVVAVFCFYLAAGAYSDRK